MYGEGGDEASGSIDSDGLSMVFILILHHASKGLGTHFQSAKVLKCIKVVCQQHVKLLQQARRGVHHLVSACCDRCLAQAGNLKL